MSTHREWGTGDDRDTAWAELYAVLPDGWAVLGPRLREDKSDWVVSAQHMRGQADPLREAYGDTEAAALRALAQQFRALHR